MNHEDPEAMAKVHGYTAAYGARTWGDLLSPPAKPVVTEGAEMSKVDKEDTSAETGHVMEMTGDPAATLDPELEASRFNRIV
jgi:hypothetical protein